MITNNSENIIYPRIVITGLGICAPNGIGINQFHNAMRDKVSGIRHHSELEALKFSCQIGGMPLVTEQHLTKVFTPLQLRRLNASGIVYECITGRES